MRDGGQTRAKFIILPTITFILPDLQKFNKGEVRERKKTSKENLLFSSKYSFNPIMK
jgi:hypothetical protein